MRKPFEFVRVDTVMKTGVMRAWYRDSYGQDRFFEFSATRGEEFGQQLIQQINEVLQRNATP